MIQYEHELMPILLLLLVWLAPACQTWHNFKKPDWHSCISWLPTRELLLVFVPKDLLNCLKFEKRKKNNNVTYRFGVYVLSPVRPFTHPPATACLLPYLFVCLSVCLSVCAVYLFTLPACLPVYAVCLSVLSAFLYICLPTFLYISESVYISDSLYIWQSVPISTDICQSVCVVY